MAEGVPFHDAGGFVTNEQLETRNQKLPPVLHYFSLYA
jgi:hypothetical protein